MAGPAKKLPTLSDLDDLPPGVKGEIIEGVLYTMTRPRFRHQNTSTAVVANVRLPFGDGRGGPGGWWILSEPGMELQGSPEFSPDVAGWRRERMPTAPEGPIPIVPDWICEVLSPATRRHNLVIKKPFYARVGVQHLWIVDLDARALSALRLEQGHWLEIGTFSDEANARIEPFDAVELDLTSWWTTPE